MYRDRCSAGLTLALLMLLLAPAPSVRAGEPDRDIVETLRAAGTFSTLIGALEGADLAQLLEQPGPFTLLAPTDEAFTKLSAREFGALLGDPKRLVAVLSRLIFAEKITSYDLARRTTIVPLRGEIVRIAFGTYGIKLDEASVIRWDLAASNGVIHIIDTVLPLR